MLRNNKDVGQCWERMPRDVKETCIFKMIMNANDRAPVGNIGQMSIDSVGKTPSDAKYCF